MSNRPAETMLPPSYGARNEASVLFRVDQLAGAPLSARPQAPLAAASAPVFTSIPGDDEGVIDLKSLSSAPPGIGAGPLGRRAPVVVAPLFSEPPPMVVEVDPTRPHAKPMSRRKLVGMTAGAVALLVFLGLGISLVFRGEERKPVTAALLPPPPPPSAPAPTTTAEPASGKGVVASDEGPSEETPKKAGKGKRHGIGKTGTGTLKIAGARPKAADPCGCKGELGCILACSAKGKM